MDFTITDRIEFPIDQVYRVHRDRLVELVPFLPNVESITVQSRREEEGTVILVNLWKARRTEIPRLAQPFVKDDMLQWTDRATWYEDEHRCVWELEFGFLRNAVHCCGENRMDATRDGQTDYVLEGTLHVDGTKIPGVPRFMGTRVSQAVESFVVKMITPNLKRTNDGVRQLLRQDKGDGRR